MEVQNRYTAAQMRDLLSYLEPIFDVVRLVDPSDTAILRLLEDGTVTREPYSCFHTWNKESRCANCTSIRAAIEGCQQTKYEFIRENVFYVVSRPLMLELPEGDSPVVMEIVSHVSDQLLLEKENGKSLAERLTEIQEKLYQDELTRVFNRRYLNEFSFLHRGMDHVSYQVGIIMLDLRQFKQINDTYGHLEGDRILTDVAAALRGRVRSTDSVIRLGGDEFLVTLTGCGEADVRHMVEELRRVVEAITPADFGYAYAERFNAAPEELEKMLDQADRRMYEEKRRNTGEHMPHT